MARPSHPHPHRRHVAKSKSLILHRILVWHNGLAINCVIAISLETRLFLLLILRILIKNPLIRLRFNVIIVLLVLFGGIRLNLVGFRLVV